MESPSTFGYETNVIIHLYSISITLISKGNLNFGKFQHFSDLSLIYNSDEKRNCSFEVIFICIRYI